MLRLPSGGEWFSTKMEGAKEGMAKLALYWTFPCMYSIDFFLKSIFTGIDS